MPPSASDEQILAAALAVIVRRGYVGATTREMAAEAGINEVTLFRRFGSKAKVLEAVLSEEAARFASAGIAHTGDLEADLRDIVTFYTSLMENRGPVILSLAGEIARNADLLTMMQTPMGVFQQVIRILERYQAEGALEPEPTVHAAAALLGPIFLTAMVSHLSQREDMFSAADVLVRRFLDGRRSGSTGSAQPG